MVFLAFLFTFLIGKGERPFLASSAWKKGVPSALLCAQVVRMYQACFRNGLEASGSQTWQLTQVWIQEVHNCWCFKVFHSRNQKVPLLGDRIPSHQDDFILHQFFITCSCSPSNTAAVWSRLSSSGIGVTWMTTILYLDALPILSRTSCILQSGQRLCQWAKGTWTRV